MVPVLAMQGNKMWLSLRTYKVFQFMKVHFDCIITLYKYFN
jgi:hypothetical protein